MTQNTQPKRVICAECGRPLRPGVKGWCDATCEHNWRATMRHFGVNPDTGRQQVRVPIARIQDLRDHPGAAAAIAYSGDTAMRMILPAGR